MSAPVVGIIANPVSARDIRRVISHAGNLQITDRANIVLRILAGLNATGVGQVVMMPENAGLRGHLMRALMRAKNSAEARFPEISYLDMPVAGDATDSARAAREMRAMDVAAIVVLGGDGTHRVVASECGEIPIAGVSSGTNNAFPQMREPTVTGLAVGLAVTGQVPDTTSLFHNKRLEVTINESMEIALVDVAIVADRFVGSRAIWKPDGFKELFVTFGEPSGIGMSSIVGLVAPVSRADPNGRRIIFDPTQTSSRRVLAPIAPGLIEPIYIKDVSTIEAGKPVPLSVSAGSIAFDGERELTFSETDRVEVSLRNSALRTIDVAACMAFAANQGRFIESAQGNSLLNRNIGG